MRSSNTNLSQKLRDKPTMKANMSTVDDLVRLPGPLTEETVFRVLAARFGHGIYHTRLGPHLIVLNAAGNRHTTAIDSVPPQLVQFVHTIVLKSTGSRQTQERVSVVLSGEKGSGKLPTCRLMIKQLTALSSSRIEHQKCTRLNEALTVLSSLGSASCENGIVTDRVGYYIENVFTSATSDKAKIVCYFTNQRYLTNISLATESNYLIFYEMLAGFTPSEREMYHLQKSSPEHYGYLRKRKVVGNTKELCKHFQIWKESLAALGVCVPDVLRVLAAVLLLGNIEPNDGTGMDVEIAAHHELKAVSMLLGVSCVTLYQSLTTCTRKAGGDVFKASINAAMTRQRRDALTQLLYARTLTAIVKKANSSLKHASNDNHQGGAISECSMSTPSMNRYGSDCSSDLRTSDQSSIFMENVCIDTVECPASVPSASSPPEPDLFYNCSVAIVMMADSQNLKENHLSELCMNLTSEVLEQYYVTHVFKLAQEELIQEGVLSNMITGFHDNTSVIQLICARPTGLLSMLDTEYNNRKSDVDTYLKTICDQHNCSADFSSTFGSCFTIRHFHDTVEYDATDFLSANQDSIADDLLWVFHESNCTFDFLTHLVSNELTATQKIGDEPKGSMFRIAALNPGRSHSPMSRDSFVSEHQAQLHDLQKCLQSTRPCFIRCIRVLKSSDDEIERAVIVRQLRSLQVLETAHTITSVYPHRIPFNIFNDEFFLFSKWPRVQEQRNLAKAIINELEESKKLCKSHKNQIVGETCVLISAMAWKQLQQLRASLRNTAVISIQTHWRRHQSQMRHHLVKVQQNMMKKAKQTDENVQLPFVEIGEDHLRSSSNLHVLDVNVAPRLPPRRMYVIRGNMKLAFPHMRLINKDYKTDTPSDMNLSPGMLVRVTGPAARNGYLVAEVGTSRFHVPHQITDLLRHPMMKMNTVAV